MTKIAVAIICKTPAPGASKTRLSPPLRPEECAEISACFIRDLSGTIAALAREDANVSAYAAYTPLGSEERLRALLPAGFGLVPQRDGDFGDRLRGSVADLLAAGYDGAIVINSDSPTLPLSILRDAVAALRGGEAVVLGPAHDGGYTLIGLRTVRRELFENVPWSTGDVFAATCRQAAAIGLPVVEVGGWYDVDDAASYAMLEDELDGRGPPFAAPGTAPAEAPATRRFVGARRTARTLA